VSAYVPSGGKVLDFGAGRLRNALYLLARDIAVCGVEYEKLASSDGAAKRYGRAKRFKQFWSLTYPDEFLRDTSKFDLVLLINVLNIMPVEGERSLVLQECFKRLNPDGHLLWYTQYGDSYYEDQCTDDNRLGDGWYLGTTRRFKTFYREFSAGEIDSLLSTNGFDFVKSFTVPHNRVRLYRKASVNPLSHIISKAELRRAIPVDPTILKPVEPKPRIVEMTAGTGLVQPNPASVSVETQMTVALRTISLGTRSATKYHRLVEAILRHVLVPSRLRTMVREKEIFEGRKRIDIHATTGKEGFFASLNPQHRILAPYVAIECKNYSEDVGNPEFDQLTGRFSPKKGQFGILVCRRITDRLDVIRHCHDAAEADDYIVVLEDGDLERLLEFRRQGDFDAIDALFEDRLAEVLL